MAPRDGEPGGDSSAGENSEPDAEVALSDVRSPLASRPIAAFRSLDRRGLFTVALLVGGVPFAASAVIAFRGGFGLRFLRTGSVYVWTVGLFVGGLTFGWWAKRYPELWVTLRPVFDVPENEYRAVVRSRIAEMYDLGRVLLWFPVVLLSGVIYDLVLVGAPYVIYVRSADPLVSVAAPTVRLPFDVYAYSLSVINYAFGIVSLVGLLIAVHVAVIHVRLVSDVMRLRIRDVRTAAVELTPLARFDVVISLGWFASLTFGMVILIATEYDPWTDPLFLSTFLLVFLFGVVLFAVPQLSIHTALQSEKRTLLGEIDAKYERMYEDLSSTGDSEHSSEEVSTRLDVLEARRRNATEIRTWAYDLPGVASLLVSSVIPLILQFGQMIA
ncbi:hypothetical protein DJ82_12405 [Halorubrum sp. Ib24]|uniref:hypothetical protein n=1 Tax=Halorubrum sp. Ib24 TaxID=1383850 RepID=UPI000B98C406|nr:hypothetical protein [Halorubrum sp. Ib24]OYR38376.1 hypothetical protein DJ82_12405 [Halorubrum sp. Ib24]